MLSPSFESTDCCWAVIPGPAAWHRIGGGRIGRFVENCWRFEQHKVGSKMGISAHHQPLVVKVRVGLCLLTATYPTSTTYNWHPTRNTAGKGHGQAQNKGPHPGLEVLRPRKWPELLGRIEALGITWSGMTPLLISHPRCRITWTRSPAG